MNDAREPRPDFLPEIRVGRIGILKVHQVSDEELAKLGEGGGQSLFLNFGIAVTATAASFLISLLTMQIDSDRIFTVFVVVTVVGFLAGAILLILWWLTRRRIGKLVNEIRDRMPPRGTAQFVTPSSPDASGDVDGGA